MRFHLPDDYSDFEARGKDADKMERGPTLELVKKIISESEGGMVLGIDAPWGTGKTSFVKMLESEIKNTTPVIYFDAFRSDYHHSPVVAIAGEIYEKAKELKLAGDHHMSSMAEAISKVPDLSLKGSLNALLRISSVLLAKQCGLEDFSSIANDVAGDLLSDMKEMSSKNMHIESYGAEKKAFEEVFNSFEKLAVDMLNVINQRNQQDVEVMGEKASNIVFIIDELDRCRPEYAIELLETVKHLFLSPHVVFILVTNKEQLAASIQGIHGSSFNSHLYLEKFIHVNIKLETTISHENQAKVEDVIEYLFGKLNVNNSVADIRILSHFAQNSNLPVRQLTKIIIMIGILRGMVNEFYNDNDLKAFVYYICFLDICNKLKLDELINICKEQTSVLSHSWLIEKDSAALFSNSDDMQLIVRLFTNSSSNSEWKNAVLGRHRVSIPDPSNLQSLILSIIRSVKGLTIN